MTRRMETGKEAPLSFHRSAGSKWVGCLVYLLMVPVFIAVAAIIGGLLGTGVAHLLRGGENVKVATGLAVGGVCSVLALIWGVRDYRRRSADRIDVHGDRLEKVRGKRAETYPFDTLEWIEGPSLTTLSLKWDDG